MEEINSKVQKMSTELYQKVAQEQAAKQKEAKTDSKAKPKDEKVVDADYKVEDEKK